MSNYTEKKAIKKRMGHWISVPMVGGGCGPVHKKDKIAKGHRGQSALIAAASENDILIVRYLLDAPGVDINQVCDKGRSALMHAAKKGHSDIVLLLLEKGANPDICDKKLNTALILGCEKGDSAMIKELVRLTENLHQINKSGMSAQKVLTKRNKRSMQAYLQQEIDLRAQEQEKINKAALRQQEHKQAHLAKEKAAKKAALKAKKAAHQAAFKKAQRRGQNAVQKMAQKAEENANNQPTPSKKAAWHNGQMVYNTPSNTRE